MRAGLALIKTYTMRGATYEVDGHLVTRRNVIDALARGCLRIRHPRLVGRNDTHSWTMEVHLGEGDGLLLFRCHHGCSQANVLAPLGECGLWPAAKDAGTVRPPAPSRREPPDIERVARTIATWAEGE